MDLMPAACCGQMESLFHYSAMLQRWLITRITVLLPYHDERRS